MTRREKAKSEKIERSDQIYVKWNKPEVGGIIPTRRYGHTATVVNNKIYIFGGYDEKHNRLNEVYVFDPETMAWKKVTTNGTPPSERYFHSACALGSEIYIFGGDTQDLADKSIKIMNDLHVLDTATLKWHKVNTENAPPPRRNHSSTIVGELMFVFGGFDGNNRLADIHVLDTATLRWEKFAPAPGRSPKPRSSHSATAIDDRIFIHGGYDGKHDRHDTWMLNIKDKVWTKLKLDLPQSSISSPDSEADKDSSGGSLNSSNGSASSTNGVNAMGPGLNFFDQSFMMPQSRSGHSSVHYNHQGRDYVLVYGGTHKDDYLNETLLFDTVDYRWFRCKLILPEHLTLGGVAFHSANVINNKMYTFGGRAKSKISNGLYVIYSVYISPSTNDMPIGPHPLFTPVSSNNLHSSHQSSSAFNRNSAQQQYLKLMDKIEKLKKQNKKLALEKDKVEVEKQMLMRENERLKGKNLGQMNLDELVVLRKNVESAIKSIDEAKEEKIRQEALDKAKRLTDEQQRCLVCLEKPKCVAFDPCGHVTCCSDCSTKFPPNSNCIVCRKTVNRILKVFIN
jgi:hypothetical protein